MRKNINKLEVIFFETNSGAEPVRDWLKEQHKEDKRLIGEDLKTVQFGWPMGMPLVDSLGRGLWEVRTNLSSNRIARIIFFMDDGAMILVNGFIKKTRKTPKDEIDLAHKRRKEYEN